MNALMRSRRFDDMPTLSAFAIGRSACAIVRCEATIDATMIRTASANGVRNLIGSSLHSPCDDSAGAVARRQRVERVVDAAQWIGARHELVQLEPSLLVERDE